MDLIPYCEGGLHYIPSLSADFGHVSAKVKTQLLINILLLFIYQKVKQ